MPEIGLHALERALSQLRTSLAYCGSDEARRDPTLGAVFRAAAIQAFEFTYELSHKVLRRHLAATSPSIDVVAELSFPDLIRTAHARKLIAADWTVWHGFRRLRSLTSHAYSEACAAEVFAGIPPFVLEIEVMLAAMRENPPP